MTDFTFETTPKIISRAGATGEIGSILAATGARHVALITDASVRALGLTEAAEASIAATGLACTVFTNIKPDPPEELVSDAVDACEGADAVAAVGGGSALDVAKVVALRLGGDQPLDEMYGVGNAIGPRVPLVLAPTTAGTGSEVTPISILTRPGNLKMGIVAPALFPDVALLDANLTLGLPQDQTAATGVDAMVHAIEAYTTKLKKNPVSDALAKEALRLLAGNIERVCDAPADVEARQAMLLGSCLAGMAFANAPCAGVHALAYPLGGHFKVPHGLSNALILPDVLAFNTPVAGAMYDQLAPIVFGPGIGLEKGFRALAPRIGLPTTLREVGVSHNHLPMMAADAMKQTRLLVNNPREITENDALAIYTAAL
ncbi:MAG: iron-containing alcohol dehydrogenase [Pseudomonadota bacterium]